MKVAHIVIATLAAAGGWYGSILFHQPSTARQANEKRILYYQSPMHPWVKADKPGKCTVCGMDLVAIFEGGRNYDAEAVDTVMLPNGSPNVMGIQTATVRKAPLKRTLKVSGMITQDEAHHGVICAPVEGRIDGLAISHDGQQIARNQPVATIFSKTLLAAAAEYKAALEKRDDAATADCKRRLEHYGLIWDQIKTIPQRQDDDVYFGVIAQLTGSIVKTYVAEGQYVNEGDKLFEVADLSKMSAMFTVYESDLPFVSVGQSVNIQLASLPGQTVKARIAGISPNLDEATRSGKIRVAVTNPDRRIKNNCFAEAAIELESPDVLAVARTAVIWRGNSPRVYVEKQPGVYQPREVKLGRAGNSDWEVLDGLVEGDRVVTSGNLLIDGQAQLQDLGVSAQ